MTTHEELCSPQTEIAAPVPMFVSKQATKRDPSRNQLKEHSGSTRTQEDERCPPDDYDELGHTSPCDWRPGMSAETEDFVSA